MKKTYKIEVDCANCANLMEDAARKTAGVQSATAGAEGCYEECAECLQESGAGLRDFPVSGSSQ